MKHKFEMDAIRVGEYIVSTGCTVREAGHFLGIGKTTICHRIALLDKLGHRILFEKVREIVDYNKETRYVRGGRGTSNKYKSYENSIMDLQNELRNKK